MKGMGCILEQRLRHFEFFNEIHTQHYCHQLAVSSQSLNKYCLYVVVVHVSAQQSIVFILILEAGIDKAPSFLLKNL